MAESPRIAEVRSRLATAKRSIASSFERVIQRASVFLFVERMEAQKQEAAEDILVGIETW